MRVITVLAIGLLLQACIALPIPHQHPYSPKLSGSVVDAESKQPVAGAVIRMESTSTHPPLENSTTAGEDGSFSVRITKRALWWALWLGPAEGFCAAHATVSAPGYAPQSKEFRRFGSASGSGMCAHYAENWAVALEKTGT